MYTDDRIARYERCFYEARELDEQHSYAKAAAAYKKAAQLMRDMANDAPSADCAAMIRSANRLLDAAELMSGKARESTPEKGSSAKEDNISFKPIAQRPNVHFEDIAGLEDVKDVIRNEIIRPALYPEVYARFNQNTSGGILLYGPPGTGKTMMARCIATEANADFFPIRCSDIVAKWFGEAERRVKALFDAARASGNAVIFFDEFEALACKRGGNSTVMNRLVPELLSQMDGFDGHNGRIIIIAATNTPWAIDSAFMRYPRLTRQIYVPLPDAPARDYHFRNLFRKMPTEDMDIDQLVRDTDGFTCADITNLVNTATRTPITRAIETKDINQFLTKADIMAALPSISASVRKEDLVPMNRWRESHASPARHA